jgi:hypothetical protein
VAAVAVVMKKKLLLNQNQLDGTIWCSLPIKICNKNEDSTQCIKLNCNRYLEILVLNWRKQYDICKNVW